MIKDSNLPILLLDLDDTINCLVSHWLEVYNKEYNDNLKKEDIKGWDIGNYTKAQDKMYILLDTPNFFKNIDIQEDSAFFIEKLMEYFDIHIVSACSYKTYADKAEWIEKKLPFFPIRKFSAVSPKYIIKGDIIIDDNYDNMRNFEGLKLLYSQPWNENIQGDFIRVRNWKEVYIELQNFLNERRAN